MSIFGGSPKAADRRRIAAAAAGRGRAAYSRPSARGNAKGGAQIPFSFTEIVPPSPVKILFGTLVGLLCSALIPSLGYFDTAVTERTGPAVAWLFSLTSHPFANWYGSLLLFLGAQLSLLIFWARSCSVSDLRGSYRLWRTAAFVILFYSFMLSNRGHLVWSKTLLFFWPDKFKGHETWSWLIPALLLGYWISRQVLADMKDCVASRALLFLGLLCHLATVVDAFDQRVIFSSWSPKFLETVRLGLLLAGQTLLFGALWLHARYVLYISVEPPLEAYYQFGILGRMIAFVGSLLALVGIGGDAAAKKRRAKKAAEAKKKKAEKAEAEEESEEETEEEEEQLSEEEELERATRPENTNGNGKNYRFDPPQNANRGPQNQSEREDMRGMSKKERRKLMQQQRDEEREG